MVAEFCADGQTQTDRETDRHDRANSCFAQLCERACKPVYDQCKTCSLYSFCHMFILFTYTILVPPILLLAADVYVVLFSAERHTKYLCHLSK